jgi:hypothetical protein
MMHQTTRFIVVKSPILGQSTENLVTQPSARGNSSRFSIPLSKELASERLLPTTTTPSDEHELSPRLVCPKKGF